MSELITVTITEGPVTYTHTGTKEAIKKAQQKMRERYKVRLSRSEKAPEDRGEPSLTPDQLRRCIAAWEAAKAVSPEYGPALKAIMAELGCTTTEGRQVVKQVREIVRRRGKA